MKLKIYISVLMLSLILNSCVKEAPMWKRTYQIKNNSGFDVTIRAFENYLGEGDFQDFTVLNGTILSGVKVEGTNFDTVDQVDNANVTTTSFSATRFIIVYNSEKRMTHSVDFDDNNNPAFSNPINRNIIRAGNYTNIGNDIYQFTLIQEDYDNAEPCNGDCLD